MESQQSSHVNMNHTDMQSNWGIDEDAVTACAAGGQVGGHIEEGIPYIAGNTLWAVYQVMH